MTTRNKGCGAPSGSWRVISRDEVKRRFREDRGVFAKRVVIWIFGSGRVKGSPILDLRRQRRSGARLRGKQGAAVRRGAGSDPPSGHLWRAPTSIRL